MITRTYRRRAHARLALPAPVLAGLVLLLLAALVTGSGLGARSVHASAGMNYTVGTTADDNGTSTAQCAIATNTTCTLRAAIAVATSGADTIQFNATGTGTIVLGNGPGQGILNLQHSVSIVGPGASLLRVDGNGVFNFAQSPPISIGVFSVPSGVSVAISGLTVQNGTGFNGGGISNAGTLSLTDSIVSGSYAGGRGGGISNSGTLTLTNTIVTDNRSGNHGGGISNSGFSSGLGTLTLINSTVTNNRAPSLGGGIVQQNGTLTLTNSTVSGNTANDSGGGIFSQTSTVTVTNSTFSGNSAVINDGGAIFNQSTLTIARSTFTGNSASNLGGAIRNDATHAPSPLTLANSTLTGNSAGNGSGIYNSGTLTVTNSTISSNLQPCIGTSCFFGGGILNGGGTLHLTNSIVAGNTLVDVNGSMATNSHNVIGTAGGPSLLGSLGNYGGPTLTIPLLPGSAAIGAGDAAVCASTAGTAPVAGLDQRGVARPAGSCDIGAFQSQGFTLSTISGDNQNAAPGTAFANPLVVAVTATAAGAPYGEPVQGGVVIFTGPTSGAGIQSSPLTAGIAANGQASTSVTANVTGGGPYSVVATAAGADPAVSFSLTNASALCQPGSFSASGSEPCTSAPAGSYVSTSGATSATLCPPGSFSAVTGASACTLAPAGSYVATSGATAPTLCPTGATSAAGATSCQVSQAYAFTGFLAPLDSAPTLNVVKAGSAVAVKFGLGGNQGLNIFAAGAPSSQAITCEAGVPVSNDTPTVTAGGSSLTYEATTDQYTYVWKTDRAWADTCRQLVLTLADGTTHTANFKFK